MPSTRISMTLNNGNGYFNNKPSLPRVVNTPVKPGRKIGMDLNTTMLGRIANAPAGCGGCGGH